MSVTYTRVVSIVGVICLALIWSVHAASGQAAQVARLSPADYIDIFGGGHYEDVYVKTAEGWRFKTRAFIASATGTEAK